MLVNLTPTLSAWPLRVHTALKSNFWETLCLDQSYDFSSWSLNSFSRPFLKWKFMKKNFLSKSKSGTWKFFQYDTPHPYGNTVNPGFTVNHLIKQFRSFSRFLFNFYTRNVSLLSNFAVVNSIELSCDAWSRPE